MDAEEDRLGLGGNSPPAPLTPLEVSRYLIDVESKLLTRRDELLAGVMRFKAAYPVILDEEMQGKAGDFVKQIAATIKISRDEFVIAKKPFLDGGRAVDAFFKSISDPLQAGMDDVRRPMTAYAVKVEEAERARRVEASRLAAIEARRLQSEIAAEQARQEAADAAQRPRSTLPPPTIEEAIAAAEQSAAADKAATAKSADLTRNRGDQGSVNSLRELWEVEVEDLSRVPAEFLMFDFAKARRAIQGGKLQAIPGCRVFVTKHVMTR